MDVRLGVAFWPGVYAVVHHRLMSVVLVSDEGGVRTVTLNRPERLNALGAELRASLEEIVADTASSRVRLVVLKGAGRAFSAGADLKDTPRVAGSWQERRRGVGRWQRLLDAFEALP